jgi:hypothetical protein
MGTQEGPEELTPQQSTKKEKLRKALFRPAIILAIITVLIACVTLGITIHSKYFTEPSNSEIKYTFVRCEVGDVVVYSGELINMSSYHAKELTLKGTFSSKILDYGIDGSDSFEKEKSNNPHGSFEFRSKRLSGKNKCQFYVMVDRSSIIMEQFRISWGEKGYCILKPQESDENISRWIKLWGKASSLSRKARQKRVESDVKYIK